MIHVFVRTAFTVPLPSVDCSLELDLGCIVRFVKIRKFRIKRGLQKKKTGPIMLSCLDWCISSTAVRHVFLNGLLKFRYSKVTSLPVPVVCSDSHSWFTFTAGKLSRWSPINSLLCQLLPLLPDKLPYLISSHDFCCIFPPQESNLSPVGNFAAREQTNTGLRQ